jgi:hypothetical protein
MTDAQRPAARWRSAPVVRVVGFLVVLAVVFAVAYGIGAAVGPTSTRPDPAPSGHVEDGGQGGHSHGGGG